ncbi:hypothetical protein D3C73_1417130 [compost metagenome]
MDQYTDLVQTVPQGVAVDEQLGGGSLQLPVVFQIDKKGMVQVSMVLPVVFPQRKQRRMAYLPVIPLCIGRQYVIQLHIGV